MRLIKIAAAACAAVVLFAACDTGKSGALGPVKTDVAQLDKRIETLSAENFVEKGGKQADIAGVVAALPKEAAITYASLDFDAASGATVLRDVRITPADNTAIGVSIETLKLWGFDAEFAKARLAGQRLTETKPLASRIDASGISAFGLLTLMAPAIDAYTDVVTDAATGLVDPSLQPTVADAMEMKMTQYDLGVGRLVLDDIVLRPWEMTPAKLEAGSDLAEIMPILQAYAAFYRTIGVDTYAMFDMKADVAYQQAGAPNYMHMGIEQIAYRGLRGWDADLGVMKGMRMDMKVSAPTGPPPAPADAAATGRPPLNFNMGAKLERAVMSGMRLDKLAGYLARGVMPPRTDTDLMAVGVMTFDNLAMTANDKPLMNIGSMKIDLSTFHWFVPTKMRIKALNTTYDVNGFVDFVRQTATAAAADDDERARADAIRIPPEIAAALAKSGLDKPSLDFAIGYDWNPKTGASTVDLAFGLDDYDRIDAKAAVNLPAFQPVSDLIPEKGAPNSDLLGKLFQDVTAFRSAEINFIDEGGFGKLYALGAELGKTLPSDAPQELAFLKSATAESLRGMASSGAYLLADTAGQQFPPAKELLRPFAAWVTDGGKVRVTAAPKEPINAAGLTAAGATPEGMLELLNVKVVHTPGPAPRPQ